MRLGLRGKLVALLVLVALLPLLAATGTIVYGVRSLQIESFGRQLSQVAAARADLMQTVLAKDAEKLLVALNEAPLAAEVSAAQRRLSEAERAALDANWADRDAADPPLRAVLDNPIAEVLNQIRRRDPRIVELLLTDRRGHLIAATGQTTDFYQADEAWWQAAYDGGRGRIAVPPISYDRSSEVWSVDLCIPVHHRGQVVGVAKAVVDVSRWVGRPTTPVGAYTASVMLVQADGRIVLGGDAAPLTARIESVPPPGADAAALWRQTAQDTLRASAPIRLPARVGGREVHSVAWALVLDVPRAQPLGAVNRLSLLTVAVGLALITLLFVAGLEVIDHSVVRRVRRLERATRRIADGDLTHRVEARWAGARLLGADEIDELAADFNHMIERIQRSHDMLQAANELKGRFIKIASHELRTPVSFILGMLSLLSATDDPQKIRHTVRTLAQKARRLSDIIESMFKLLPEQAWGEELHYTTVGTDELVQKVVADCTPFAERRRQRLDVQVPDDAPSVHADRGMLVDVVENLMMNAIKFTPDGGQVTLRVGRQIGGYVTLAVSDQGPGIPQHELPHIFEPFYAGGEVFQHSSGRDGYQKRGMGLGLAVVRHFVRLHGGTVEVNATPSGSTFTVVIPVEPPPRRQRPEQPAG
jgi:signal transduction histidine kinase